MGLRATAVTGAVLASLGLALSASHHTEVGLLYLSYGLMFGAGASLVYTPSLTVLGQDSVKLADGDPDSVQDSTSRSTWAL